MAARPSGAQGALARLRQVQRRLREVEQRYELVMGAIHEGAYDWNIAKGTIHFSERVCSYLGLPHGTLRTPEDWLARIHPDDLAHYRAVHAAHFKGLTPRLECDYRYRGADQGWRWARTHGLALRDGKGRAVRMVGSTGDITDLKRVEDALQESQARYELVMRAINEGVYEWDIVNGTAYFSERLYEALKLAPADFEGPVQWRARIHPEDLPVYDAALKAHFKGQRERFECDYRYRAHDGSWRWARQRGLAVRDKTGRAVRMSGSAGDITDLKRAELELRRARDEATEALEQQTATAEILRVISSTPTDTQPVFDAITRSGLRIFAGTGVGIALVQGERVRVVSADGELGPMATRVDMPLSRESASGTAILDREAVNVVDTEAPDAPRYARDNGRALRFRSIACAPMLREGAAIGAVAVTLQRPGGLSRAHLNLLKTFADQAVIAIENVRLFNETTEALERQTATAEILRVIAGSPADVQPVFEAIIRSATRLAGGCSVNVSRLVGDQLHLAAYTPVSPEADEILRGAYPVAVDEARPLAEAVRKKAAFFVSDFESDPDVSPKARELMRARGFRSTLYVPIMHGEVVHGVMHVSKVEPGPFPQQWIDLLRTFADQAVIAIENVRLFNETREALERQTAISEILRVMSASPTDVQPVFQTIVSSAARLCGSTIGAIFRYDGERIHYVAGHNFDDPSRLEAIRTKYPAHVDSSLVSGRVIQTLSVVHIDDAASDPRYDPAHARLGGWRRMMGVPMLKDGVPLGVIVVAWDRPGVTPKSQEELLKTFADQAVIAVENMRLFNETHESLERQTATTEVLKVISQARVDLEPVLDIVLRNARRLCDADRAIVFRADSEGNYAAVAVQAAQPAEEVMDFYRRNPIRPGRSSATGRALLECRAVQVADVLADPEYRREYAATRTYRTILAVPLLREGMPIGVLTVSRIGDPRPFSDKQIGLVTSFADQAVIAIENVRLFHEIQEKSRQLEQASRHKSEFLANMSHELRTPLNAIIGFTRIVMRRSKEQLEPKQYENLEKIHSSGQHLLALINAILDLSKVEAGRVEVTPAEVALDTVLEQCMKTVEPLVRSPAVRLVKEFDGGLPRVYADEEKLRQIVMNLLGNAAKFTERGSVRVRAGCSGERLAVAVADTGIGIPADKLEHVFDEFAQADASSTRVYGGTGLGLTIARRLARLMGGDISAESTPGLGSTFTLTLPLRYPV